MLLKGPGMSHKSLSVHIKLGCTLLNLLPIGVPALARSKQEALDALPADYYQPDYDPVAGELAMLPRMFTESDLEAVVEERSGVLEVCAIPQLQKGSYLQDSIPMQ